MISCATGHLAGSGRRLVQVVALGPAPVISLAVVDLDDQAAAILDRVAPAKAEVELNDQLVREVAAAESSDLAVLVAVAATDQEDREAVIDLGVQVMAIDLAVREAEVIGPVDQVMEIGPDVREMAIDQDDLVTVTDPADRVTDHRVPVRAAAASSGVLAIGRIVPGVPVTDPIGRTVPTDRIADRIGTNGKIGGTIVGQT